jgi:hypothetical protein
VVSGQGLGHSKADEFEVTEQRRPAEAPPSSDFVVDLRNLSIASIAVGDHDLAERSGQILQRG